MEIETNYQEKPTCCKYRQENPNAYVCCPVHFADFDPVDPWIRHTESDPVNPWVRNDADSPKFLRTTKKFFDSSVLYAPRERPTVQPVIIDLTPDVIDLTDEMVDVTTPEKPKKKTVAPYAPKKIPNMGSDFCDPATARLNKAHSDYLSGELSFYEYSNLKKTLEPLRPFKGQSSTWWSNNGGK